MLYIASWDNDALPAGQAGDLASVEKPLDLFVDPADCLDLPTLVDGAGNRQRSIGASARAEQR
jgi:hypothetical protein